jgi:hypothetical protein
VCKYVAILLLKQNAINYPILFPIKQKRYSPPERNADTPKRFHEKSVPRPGLDVLEEILFENFS